MEKSRVAAVVKVSQPKNQQRTAVIYFGSERETYLHRTCLSRALNKGVGQCSRCYPVSSYATVGKTAKVERKLLKLSWSMVLSQRQTATVYTWSRMERRAAPGVNFPGVAKTPTAIWRSRKLPPPLPLTLKDSGGCRKLMQKTLPSANGWLSLKTTL